MRTLRAILGCGVTLAAIGCGSSLPAVDYSAEPDPRRQEFIIGPSDTLRVNVWKNPDLTTEVTVRPDGIVTMPVVGDLRASGRTSSQLRTEMRQRLASFVKDQSVQLDIIVTSINSYRFTVAGNVERGGLFNAKYYLTLTEAISMAGGVNRYAAQDRIVVIRKSPSGVRNIPVNLKTIYSGENPAANIVILTEDTIYVP